MIELPVFSPDFVRSLIQNFTIIATLVLLYSFIPDILLLRSKMIHALSVGAVFGLAAVVSIPSLWQTTDTAVLGFNVILVPLAGYAGGPVSSAVVAGVLLTGCYASGGSLSAMDALTVMSGILVGAFVYYGPSWPRFPRMTSIHLILLGAGVVLTECVAFILAGLLSRAPGGPAEGVPLLSILPFLVVSFLGTVILGSIIIFIDRKRQAEKELLEHKEHLEDLVKRRTAELRQAVSLQKATIESTADAIIVVDREGVIRAYNQKILQILNLPPVLPEDPAGAGTFRDAVAARLPDPGPLFRQVDSLPESAEEIVSSDLAFSDGRIYELFVHPQMIGDRTIGRVWSFHDITDQRHAEDALRAVNNKLVLLASITRHDILNQMTALGIHLDLAREKTGNTPAAANLGVMEKTLEVIRLQLEFTRDYQDLGLQKPVWKTVSTAFSGAAASFADPSITVRCDTANLEIFTDPMIERVFHNFIDNSIRHGGRVTEIRLFTERRDPDLLLIYEDNGTGVLPEEKEKIFLKGFGKHTGLGMFLIREILSITGLTIRENGVAGRGARFEILVPAGKFRFTS